MADLRLMIDGVLLEEGQTPMIPLDDGFVRGDGVFEGMRLYDHVPRTLEAHLDRLERSAGGVSIPFDRAQMRDEITRISEAATDGFSALRTMLSRGGHRVHREEPLIPDAPDGWVLHPVDHRVTPLLIGAKTLSYAANMQAAREATAAGANTALFVEADSRTVLECPVASLVWFEGADVCAPPLSSGVLDSITRRLLAEVVELQVRARTLDELADADGALVISTVLESRTVREIQGVAVYDIASPRVAEIAAALHEASVSGDPDRARTVPV
jgi:branched-subunit amino acid aminotransferase/4-amino-4-deoxychorismate lyase